MTDLPPRWLEVKPGTRAALHVPVVARADGSTIELPLLVVRGAGQGRTLLATAGVHGDEFEGMAAIRQFVEILDPLRLSGTFVGVTTANPPAFEAGLRTNPDDRQDLARVFPGDPAGTVTEQIAHVLTYRIIRHADLYCDLHSAGQFYAMPAMVGYQLRAEPILSMQRQAARLFGLPVVWGTSALPGRSLSAAGELGVPAIYAEITGEGRCRPADVERYVHGLRQLAALLGMTGDALAPHEPEWFVEDDRPQAGILQVQNRAPTGGFFEPQVEVWQRVDAGQVVGVIRNAIGAVQHTVRAGYAGRIVFLRTFPRVLAGDPVCTVLQTER
jgi:predicted deacylase